MPNCQNCGAHVTEDYARVFAPEHVEGVRACPNCEDLTRGSDGVREKRT